MAGNPDIKLHAAKGGQNSWKRRKALSVARLDEHLTPLTTPDQAKDRLQLLQRWVIEGIIPTPVASAAIRAVEVWLRAEAQERDRQRVSALEAQLAALEAQLAGRAH